MMRVGLIPPRGLENYALRSKFHLALAIPELMARRTYGGMYTRMSALGDTVVLDNGLAEGTPATPELLLRYAKQVKAKEVVTPDVMKDCAATVKAVTDFFKLDVPLDYSFMAVAQGMKLADFHICVEAFAGLPFVSTVGLPRHMLGTLNSRACRIDLANWINGNYPSRFDVHLLGTNPGWIPEVRHAAKYAPFIRSVDTSMPFNYALVNEDLDTTSVQVTRPDKYFETDWVRRVNSILLRKNIYTLLRWANASEVRTETSISKLRDVPTTEGQHVRT